VFALRELTHHQERMFPEKEEKILRASLKTAPETTSMGRVLDALSCLLGTGCERTYDGEPAMRLEPLLEMGTHRPGLFDPPEIRERNGVRVVNQLGLFSALFEILDPGMGWRERADLATSFVHRIMEGLVEAACDFAENRGIRDIGITGGVAYSLPILRMFESPVEKRGLNPVFHRRLPPGDGEVSAGQAYAAGVGRGKERG